MTGLNIIFSFVAGILLGSVAYQAFQSGVGIGIAVPIVFLFALGIASAIAVHLTLL